MGAEGGEMQWTVTGGILSPPTTTTSATSTTTSSTTAPATTTIATPGAPQITSPPALDLGSVNSLLNALGLSQGVAGGNPLGTAALGGADLQSVVEPAQQNKGNIWILVIAALIVGVLVWYALRHRRSQ